MRVAVLGKFDFRESHREIFQESIDSQPIAHPRLLRVAAFATSVLTAILLLIGLTGLISWIRIGIALAPLIAFHAAVGMVFQPRVKGTINLLRTLSFELEVLREGLEMISKESFHSSRLRSISAKVARAPMSLRKLERLLNALTERDKEWFYLPYLALLITTQLCWSVEHWKAQYAARLCSWLDAWAEFEALNAIARYAWENPENVYPDAAPEVTSFDARDLGHPLIPAFSCVTNNITLNCESSFYVVSGSNMAGKSTLLRAIGLNAVLAFAGAPVRASSLRVSQLSVCASLSVVDSLHNGKSRFTAEMDRLRVTLDTAIKTPVLYLIDEILSGTNSSDRRIAAEAVIRTLVDRGAIGALSTHDLALTEIVSGSVTGRNVHMSSATTDSPMEFDYRLKPGITKESNALAIARMAGVPV